MKQLFKDKKWWLETLKIIFIGIVINAFCFFVCSITGHCETINSVLPYLCQNDNSYYNELEVQNALSLVNEKYPNDDIYNKKFFVCYGIYNAWYTYNDYIEVPAYYIYVCPDNLNLPTTWSSSSTFENFQFNSSGSYIDVNLNNYDRYIVFPQSIQNNGYNISKFGGGVVRLFGELNTHTISNRYFEITVPGLNYPVYTTSQFSTVDRTATEGYILAFADTIVDVGEFTDLPPLDEILNNISGSYTPHTNNSPPTYDNTLSDGQNITNAITGHANNINNAINNLGENVKNFFNKLYEKLTNVGNAISTNVHNGFATLMQNIKDFFGPKLDKITDLLTQLVNDDETDVIETWENTQLYSDFDQLSQTVENGFGVWQDTSEPNTYKIAFHVEQIPLLHCDTVQYIDLGLFSPVIPYIRSIMWALMVYSVFYTVIDSIANYLNGGDE